MTADPNTPPFPISFTEAMHSICGRCGKTAGLHRLDSRGIFYCLQLNTAGETKREAIKTMGDSWTEQTLMVITTDYLKTADIDPRIGDVINAALRGRPTVSDANKEGEATL